MKQRTEYIVATAMILLGLGTYTAVVMYALVQIFRLLLAWTGSEGFAYGLVFMGCVLGLSTIMAFGVAIGHFLEDARRARWVHFSEGRNTMKASEDAIAGSLRRELEEMRSRR